MAIKTFTTGEVLTASDTNTYLANSGLVYISSTTVGTAVSSVTVSSVFSSTYDSYRVLYTGGVKSTDGAIGMTLSGVTTGYYESFVYGNYAGTTVTNYGVSAGASWTDVGGGYSGAALVDMTLYGPNLSLATNGFGVVRYSTYWGTATMLNTNTTQSTGFTISCGAGTMTGGTIAVYGFRKA
jgi:hypothetical protein